MMESVLRSGFGAALGLAVAYAALRTIQTLEIRDAPRLADVGLNLWVLGFTALIAVLTGMLSGLAPAFHAPARGIAVALREGDRQTGSPGQGRLRAVLVSGEVALSFFLLVGAGLLIRSFTQLMNVNRRFQKENRRLFSVSMPNSYWQKGAGKQFLARFFCAPVGGASGDISRRSKPSAGGERKSRDGNCFQFPSAIVRGRCPLGGMARSLARLFSPIGLPVLKGRLLDEGDRPVWTERGQPVPARRVVISERLAKLIFPDECPVGKHAILWKGQSNLDAEVVGVVGDMRERGLTSGATLTVFLPYGRNALTSEIVVHTRGNPLALMPTVRSIVASLDPNLPIAEVRSFEEVVHRSVAPQRLNAILLGVFSGLALLLVTTGIYAVLVFDEPPQIGDRPALPAGCERPQHFADHDRAR